MSFDLPGVSIATGSTISYAPGIYLVKLLQRVPGLNKLDADPETIQNVLAHLESLSLSD